MQQALYAPGLGYYSGGAQKFGAGGDFVTAPELSPLFARCLSVQLIDWLSQTSPCIWEFGAGSGALAADLLVALAEAGVTNCQYHIVDVSSELAQRQRTFIAQRAPQVLSQVRWLHQLPAQFDGVVLGNELLDAMPVRCFRLRGERVFERGVVWQEDEQRLGFEDRIADARFEGLVRQALAASGWPSQAFGDDYRAELGEQAAAWVGTVAARLRRGAILLIDYGFPAAEFYHPQRGEGTLRCHYRHHSHDDPFWMPGLCDITAHVDFSAIYGVACSQSLECLGFTSQANFLLNCDFAAQFERLNSDAPDGAARARLAQSAAQLVSEAEMGELFKAIAFCRGASLSARGFARRDRQRSLQAV